MTIKHNTTQSKVYDTMVGSLARSTDPTVPHNRPNSVDPEDLTEPVENGQIEATEDIQGMVPSDPTHNETSSEQGVDYAHIKRTLLWESSQRRLLREATGSKGNVDREIALAALSKEVDAEEKHVREVRALAETSSSEERGRKAEAKHEESLRLVPNDRKESTAPVASVSERAEWGEEESEKLLSATAMTMRKHLMQLAEDEEMETESLNELEKNVEEEISARLEAQASEHVSTPYTAQSLEARIAQNKRDIAVVQAVLRKRKSHEERKGRLAHVGAGNHDQQPLGAQAAEHEPRKVEAERRRNVRVEALERIETLKKEEQARDKAQETKQTTWVSDKGLISLLRDNDLDIAAAYEVLKRRKVLKGERKELDLLEARVARRNRQIADAFSSEPTTSPSSGETLPCHKTRPKIEEDHKLRLMIYRQLKEYMQWNGTAAASSLLRALSGEPVCTPSQLRLKDALHSAIQQHIAETGSRDEGPGPDMLPGNARTDISQHELPMQYMIQRNTTPLASSYTADSTFPSPTQRPQTMKDMQEIASISRGFSLRNRLSSSASGAQSNGRPPPDFLQRLNLRHLAPETVQPQPSPLTCGEDYFDKDMHIKVEENRKEDKKQRTELPGILPSGRLDSGAVVHDPDLGVHEVIELPNEIDQEQTIAAELPVENTVLENSQIQRHRPEFINNTSIVLIGIDILYAMLWSYTYWKMSQQIYPTPARVFVGFCVLKDTYNLYNFGYSEYPGSIAFSILFAKAVDYFSTIYMTTWYGPTCALSIVWLVPFFTRLLRWCINRSCSFENDYRGMELMQGPFPYRKSDEKRTGRLASFGINPNRISLAIFRHTWLSVVYSSLRFIALFSGESYLAKLLAVMLYMLVPTWRLSPCPQLIEEANMMGHLLNREHYRG